MFHIVESSEIHSCKSIARTSKIVFQHILQASCACACSKSGGGKGKGEGMGSAASSVCLLGVARDNVADRVFSSLDTSDELCIVSSLVTGLKVTSCDVRFERV